MRQALATILAFTLFASPLLGAVGGVEVQVEDAGKPMPGLRPLAD